VAPDRIAAIARCAVRESRARLSRERRSSRRADAERGLEEREHGVSDASSTSRTYSGSQEAEQRPPAGTRAPRRTASSAGRRCGEPARAPSEVTPRRLGRRSRVERRHVGAETATAAPTRNVTASTANAPAPQAPPPCSRLPRQRADDDREVLGAAEQRVRGHQVLVVHEAAEGARRVTRPPVPR